MPIRRRRLPELRVIYGGAAPLSTPVAASGDGVQASFERPVLMVLEGGSPEATIEHLALIDRDRELLAHERQSARRRLRTRSMLVTTTCSGVLAAVFMR